MTISHTALASRCAPPKEPVRPVGPILSFIAAAILALVVVAGAFIVLAILDEFTGEVISQATEDVPAATVPVRVGVPAFILFWVRSRRSARYDAACRAEYPALLGNWQWSWLCMKCGRDYVE